MALDEDMNSRFRKALDGYDNISEKKMMGGICFLHQGNMIGGCSIKKTGEKHFMFRVGKQNEAEGLTREGAIPVVLGERRMGGMIFVDEKACDEQAMTSWVSFTFEFIGDLPAKG